MSNWRDKLLWQMLPLEAPTNDSILDRFKIDVKNEVSRMGNFPMNRFEEFYSEFLMEDGNRSLTLPIILFYIKQGYNWFVKQVAESIHDNY